MIRGYELQRQISDKLGRVLLLLTHCDMLYDSHLVLQHSRLELGAQKKIACPQPIFKPQIYIVALYDPCIGSLTFQCPFLIFLGMVP